MNKRVNWGNVGHLSFSLFRRAESISTWMVTTICEKKPHPTLACTFCSCSGSFVGSLVVLFSLPWPWLQCEHLNNSICDAQLHNNILPPLPSLFHWCFNSPWADFLLCLPLSVKKTWWCGKRHVTLIQSIQVFPLTYVSQCKSNRSYPSSSTEDY